MKPSVKPAPRRVLYWVVRMGRVRGRGSYVGQWAGYTLRWSSDGHTVEPYNWHTAMCQRDAFKATTRAQAEMFAEAYDGRVVAVVAMDGKR